MADFRAVSSGMSRRTGSSTAEALARADYEYRKIDPNSVLDSVEDIVKSLQGKGTAGRKERVVSASGAGADPD